MKISLMPAMQIADMREILSENLLADCASKLGKLHDTFEKVISFACCRLQKLVEAPPQAPDEF